jgi:hypothetical protein
MAVVFLAGAEWLLNQPVAGQETKKHIYRPGLRNSLAGDPLSAKELNLALAQLRSKTGFIRMRFDEDGFLTIDDRSQIAGGSATARELLLAAVDGEKSINLQSRNRSPDVVFARVGRGVVYECWQSNKQIVMAPVEIDFADFNHLRGERKVLEAFDLGFAILHELCHAALGLHDASENVRAAGDCESYVNRIRRELGIPERQRYVATVYQRSPSVSNKSFSIAELIFERTKSGAKKERLYLRWDVGEVGNSNRHGIE